MVAFTLEKSPEIDGVMRSLERHGSDFGDGLSDDYWRMIDFATHNRLDPDYQTRVVGRILEELEREDRFISQSLESGSTMYDIPDLQERYQFVLASQRHCRWRI